MRDLTRRSFLKGIAALPVLAVIPSFGGIRPPVPDRLPVEECGDYTYIGFKETLSGFKYHADLGEARASFQIWDRKNKKWVDVALPECIPQ